MCYVLLSIKCAEPRLTLTPLGNMNRLAPVATNQRETRLVTFTVESFNACRPLCPTNSSTVTQGPSGRQAETESGQPSKHPYGHWHVEKKQACPCFWSCNVHWTEGPKALSHVMLFNIKEAIVIDACCGETHRHTTFTKNLECPTTRCKLNATLGRTTTVPTPVLGLSRCCLGRCFLKCFSVQHCRGFLRGVLEFSLLGFHV